MMELTDAQQKEIVNIICDSYKYSKDRYEEFYTLCGYLHSLYEIQTPDALEQELEEENPGLMPADVHVGVNELLAQLYDIIFALDPWFRCTGGHNTSERKLRNITSYLKTAAYRSKFKRSYTPSLKSAIDFGVGWGYVDITEIAMNVLKRDLNYEGSRLKYADIVPENKFICPSYAPCNLRRCFPDPDNPKKNWFIYQTKSSLLDLLEDQNKAEELRKYKCDFEKIKNSSFPQSDWDEFFDTQQDYKSGRMKEYNKSVELLHFRGWMPMPKDDPNDKIPEFKDIIATIANREILIQFEENQWHYPAVESFIPTFIFPEDDDYVYPLSKIGAAKNTLLQKFYLRNRQLMALARNLTPAFWTDDQSKTFPSYIEARGGEVTKVSRGAKLEAMKTAEVSKESYLEMNNLTNEVQFIIGSNQFSSNVTPPRQQLATGIIVLKGMTDTLRKFESNVIVDTGLTTILQRYYDIGRLTLERTPIELFDTKETVPMGAEDIDGGDVDIQINRNDVWNQPIQRAEMQQMAAIYKDDAFVDPIEFRRRHFRLLKFTEVEKLVPDPKDKMLAIEKENMNMVKFGYFEQVLPEEDHELHLKGHEAYIKHPIVAEHAKGHVAMLEKKEQSPNVTRGSVPENELDLAQKVAQGLNQGKTGE